MEKRRNSTGGVPTSHAGSSSTLASDNLEFDVTAHLQVGEDGQRYSSSGRVVKAKKIWEAPAVVPKKRQDRRRTTGPTTATVPASKLIPRTIPSKNVQAVSWFLSRQAEGNVVSFRTIIPFFIFLVPRSGGGSDSDRRWKCVKVSCKTCCENRTQSVSTRNA